LTTEPDPGPIPLPHPGPYPQVLENVSGRAYIRPPAIQDVPREDGKPTLTAVVISLMERGAL